MTIFLDVDGVLNQLQPNYYLDDRCIKVLAKLVKELDVDVVLTSTWILGFTHGINRCSPQIVNLRNK